MPKSWTIRSYGNSIFNHFPQQVNHFVFLPEHLTVLKCVLKCSSLGLLKHYIVFVLPLSLYDNLLCFSFSSSSPYYSCHWRCCPDFCLDFLWCFLSFWTFSSKLEPLGSPSIGCLHYIASFLTLGSSYLPIYSISTCISYLPLSCICVCVASLPSYLPPLSLSSHSFYPMWF